jgi:hypothetical protein
MYVALVPNRGSPPAYLLREGYREDGKVKSRTLANLSHWSLAKIERLRRVLRDEMLSGAAEGLTMLRSLPHGHVAAVLGIARKIGLDPLLAGQAPARLATLVLAMILARVIIPPPSWPPRDSSTSRPPPHRSPRCWNCLGELQVTEFIELCRAQHTSTHVESAVMWSCPTKLPFDAARRASDST